MLTVARSQELLFLREEDADRPWVVLDPVEARRRWDHERASLVVGHPGREPSREEVLEAERAQDQYDREAEEMERLTTSGTSAAGGSVLVAHRHDWAGARLADGLSRAGHAVLPVVDDATRALAALVCLQPPVLVTSDRLLGGLAMQLATRAAVLSPSTAVVVQVEQDGRWEQARDAGAAAVLSHRAPVAAVVSVVQGLLRD